MIPQRVIILLLTVLIAAGSGFTAEMDKPEIAGTRGSKHMIVPFVGYQTLTGEQTGFTYKYDYIDYIEFDTTHIEKSGDYEEDNNYPELGLMYRYSPYDFMFIEGMASVLLAKADEKYKLNFDIDYSQSSYVLAQKSDITNFGVGVGFNIPTGLSWLVPTLHLNGSYAMRTIEVKTRFEEQGLEEIATIKDAESFYIGRAGVDLSLWKNNNFLVEFSMYYSMLMPTDSDLDPFGGLGWRMAFFPLWRNSSAR